MGLLFWQSKNNSSNLKKNVNTKNLRNRQRNRSHRKRSGVYYSTPSITSKSNFYQMEQYLNHPPQFDTQKYYHNDNINLLQQQQQQQQQNLQQQYQNVLHPRSNSYQLDNNNLNYFYTNKYHDQRFYPNDKLIYNHQHNLTIPSLTPPTITTSTPIRRQSYQNYNQQQQQQQQQQMAVLPFLSHSNNRNVNDILMFGEFDGGNYGKSTRRRRKGERTSWEYHTVTVTRLPGYGFGIAVSGGRDNPHFANGDPSIAVSDVLKAGPAEDRLQVNDRIISVNGVSLENVEYATAVQVLRDSGNTVTLVIKRRVPNLNMIPQTNHSHQHSHLSLSSTGLGGVGGVGGVIGTGGTINGLLRGGQSMTPQQTIKLFLTKSNKKDDFGIVLGCRLFIKEISTKARDQLAANGYMLQEGDIVSRIHNTNCNDAMSLKESKKIIDGCKERLNLVVLRDMMMPSTTINNNNNNNNSGMQSPVYSHTAQISNCSNIDEQFLPGGPSYSAQNLYVQPPTRPAISTLLDDKSNLTPRGRSRGPLMDVSLSQLDRPSTPQGSHIRSRSGTDEPPRPPPPRGEDFYSSRRQLYDDDPLQRSKQSAEPRFISFQKEGSVGIRLTGGNEAGIFVTAVQPGSPASLQGLTPGDKILKVNEMDMNGFTREEAVLFLLSLQDRIDLIVQHCKDEYDTVVANQRGDSFHIKTHFHYENPSKGEMSFKAGDVFRVIDTLHNGVVGSWQVLRIGRGQQEMQRGVIPNKSRAEELATAQFNATKKEMNASESRGNFFRRRRSTHRRSKSLSRENWDDVVFSDSISKFPAYERVVLRHPGFVRPVVLFGGVADMARDRLIKDFPDKFTAPLQDDGKSNTNKSGIVRLSNIRDIMDRGKHALLDITPNAVDRLNYAQFYPIVIFLKADTKHIIKQLRQGVPKSAHKSSKKLLEQCQKLERVWSHVFSTSITLNDADIWYRKLRESVDQQQSGAVWMSETKLVELPSDIFLPYLPPPCPCCSTSYSSHSQSHHRRSQTPLRYSMPILPPSPTPTPPPPPPPPPPSVYQKIHNEQQTFQIIPIKNQQIHSNSLPGLFNNNNQNNNYNYNNNYNNHNKSTNSLLTSFKTSVPNLENITLSNKNLIEHRNNSPYYYNEISGTTVSLNNNSGQFDSNLDISQTTQCDDSSDETLFDNNSNKFIINNNNNNNLNNNMNNINDDNFNNNNNNNNILNNTINNNNNNDANEIISNHIINLNNHNNHNHHQINNNNILTEHEQYLGFV